MRLERSVDPPWIQCTTWCAALHFAGRSQPGHRQWPSRALSARRAGPDTVRLERPTSITVDSDPSKTRITPESHANRSTVLDEIGSEKSISAAGAPARPSRVSTELAAVILAGLASQRLQRRAHCRSTHSVEVPVENVGAVLPHAQVETAVLDLLGLLGGIALGVGRVAEMTADVVELARRVLARLLQEPALLKAIRDRVQGAGHDCEMRETDLAALHGLDALGQSLQVLAHRQAGGSGSAGHMTGVADPVDGARRALLVVLIGMGELSRGLRELQLQAVDGLAEADELVAQQLSGHTDPTPYCHDHIIRTSVWSVKKIVRLISRSTKTRGAQSVHCDPT